jgi:DNA repair exonuclease SbcCD ATPase subunit
LRSLEVYDFRVLREVRLTLGQGFNVLFGPNDLGKSSIADALRAAFLLPFGSTESCEFIPWGTDLVPRVVVVFEVKGAVWKITKTFGSGARGTALLERCGLGGGLCQEAQGRQVEGKVREILAWGVPSPGGKGAPRGLPASYLTTALLARQDEVIAILEASLEKDRVDSGRNLITEALGALGQDPLVSRLLERLEDRVQETFTPTGQAKRTGPLAQRTQEINRREDCLRELEERVRRSKEIEQRVQSLTEQQNLATENCGRIGRRLKLLQAVGQAELELDRIRATERSAEDLRGSLAQIEEDVTRKEAMHQAATSALRRLEEDLRVARERLAKASGAREKLEESFRHDRDARQAELVARRNAAAQRAQSAREVIQAREQVQAREQELAEAELEHQRAQQSVEGVQNLAELASLLARQRQALAMLAALRIAEEERDNRAARVAEARTDLKKLETGLDQAKRTLTCQKETLVKREVRKETLRASLSKVEAAEREASQALARVRTSCKRMSEAEKALAGLEAAGHELEVKITANDDRKKACEASLRALWALPLVTLLFGGATVALGLWLKVPGLALAVAAVAFAILAPALAAIPLRRQRIRDDVVKARENLLEKRNLNSAKRVVAEAQVTSARSELEQLDVTAGNPEAALKKAEARLQEARSALPRIQGELAAFDGDQQPQLVGTVTVVKQTERAAADLEKQVLEGKQTLDAARHDLAKAEARMEVATSSAASVDLPDLERRVEAARRKLGDQANVLVPEPEEAETKIELARQAAAEYETGVKVSQGRLSDARSRFEELASRLGQPPDQVLAEAEKAREDVDRALEDLENTLSTELAAAEKECQESQTLLTRLEEDLGAARTQTEAATQARDEARTRRDEASGKLDALCQSVPISTVAAAEAALAQARRELEQDPAGPNASPEDIAQTAAILDGQREKLRRTENELHAARGQLALVGGSVAKEQLDQEREVLERLRASAEDLELEFKGARRLLDVLNEVDAKHGAHLGRSLAKPVTEKFVELTAGRYAGVVMDPDLRVRTIAAKSGERDPAALSVGTRDQLATLVRLALAAHLKSVVLLDDQLTHSDLRRMEWFRERLRASVLDHGHQIIVITCRPSDYLLPEEMPGPQCERFEAPDGRLTVVDLERLTS